MKRVRQFVFVGCLPMFLLTLSACACRGKITDIKEDIRGICTLDNDSQAARMNLYYNNSKLLESKYGVERQFYRNYTSPQIGLALSGGGTRSASFSIGVLKALTELNLMEKVDIVSAVSGGAYATYWYYSQNCYLNRPDKQYDRDFCNPSDRNRKDNDLLEYYRAEFSPTDLFQAWNDPARHLWDNNLAEPDTYRFQLSLENSSNILNYKKKAGVANALQNVGQYTADVGSLILSIPVHWLFNGIFDWDVNLNPYRRYYQNGLERTYGYVPLAYNLEHFANDTSLLFPVNHMQSLATQKVSYLASYDSVLFPRNSSQQISLTEVGDYLKAKLANEAELEKKRGAIAPRDKALPFFIINTTGGFDRGFKKFQCDGSENPKYKCCKNDQPEARIRAIKETFDESDRDMRAAVFEFTPLWYGSNLVGYYSTLDNADEISFSHAVSISGAAVDGQMENIDIAGNSHGSPKAFEATLNLLNSDLGYRVTNPQSNPLLNSIHKLMPYPIYMLFDAVESPAIHLSDGGQADNLGLFSLVRRGVERIIVVDAEQDGKSTFGSAKHLKVRLEKELGLKMSLHQPHAINVYNTPTEQAVISGTIEGLVDDKGKEKNITLYYIKLSVDLNKLQAAGQGPDPKYPFSVTSYQQNHSNFPHESTADIFYSPEQYRAYRDLGYTIVMENEAKFEDLRQKNRLLGAGTPTAQ
jgi:hypothetical protein